MAPPHLDSAELVTRAMAAEESRKARAERDRVKNEARIRDQIESGEAGVGGRHKSVHCGICGSPFGDRTKPRNACAECIRRDWEEGVRDKLSPEELYPEHFDD